MRKIAMICNEELFKKVRDKINPKLKWMDFDADFENYPYLTNDFTTRKGEGLGTHDNSMIRTGTDIFEFWDEELFLKYVND